MKAIILAGGRNTRLRGDIEDIPKTLLKAGNETILERQINALKKAGLSEQDILVITGYKHEMIEKIYSNTLFNDIFEKTNNGYGVYIGLKHFFEKLKIPDHEEILIFDGDLIYDVDLIMQIFNFGKKNVFVSKPIEYSQTLKDEVFIVNEKNEVLEMTIPVKGQVFDEKYKEKELFTYLGIVKLSTDRAKQLMNSLENRELWNTWYTIPMPEIVNKGGFHHLQIPKSLKFIFDVDTKEDLNTLNEIFSVRKKTKAIILAGGINQENLGSVRGPKELIKVGDETLLERQINLLKKSGLSDSDIFVVTGYKHELINQIHANTILNEKYKEYGNSYGVYLALNRVLPTIKSDEQVIILDGDLFYEETLISQILQNEKSNLMITKPVEYLPTIKDEIILTNSNNFISEILLPPHEKFLDIYLKNKKSFLYLGILKMSSQKAIDFLNSYSSERDFFGWYTIPLKPLLEKGDFYNYAIQNNLKFVNVDTDEDFQKLKKMFVAGPVNVSPSVKKAMVYSEIGHREPEFINLYKSIREKLLYVFGVPESQDYETFVVGGSGTSAIETVLSSVLHQNKKTLIIANGAFGERIAEICNTYSIPSIVLDHGWGVYPSLREIEETLLKNPEIEAVAMVLMETSTGMLNPVNSVGKLCKNYNKFFIVDAVSSLGGEKLNMVEDNVDYCITNTNKCLGGLPVLGIVCVRKSSLERSRDVVPCSYTLDLFKHLKYARINETPFTPHIPLYFMLNQALDELIEEKIEKRIERYKNNGLLLRKHLSKVGLRFYLKEEEMSNLMINLLVPEGLAYDQIHNRLKQKGYIIYPGKGPLSNKIIHIANIGTLDEKDIVFFCEDLKDILKELYTKMAETAMGFLRKLE